MASEKVQTPANSSAPQNTQTAANPAPAPQNTPKKGFEELMHDLSQFTTKDAALDQEMEKIKEAKNKNAADAEGIRGGILEQFPWAETLLRQVEVKRGPGRPRKQDSEIDEDIQAQQPEVQTSTNKVAVQV